MSLALAPPPYHELYDALVEATGSTPGKQLDQDLRGLYQRHPSVFATKTREVIDAWNANRVTSPWPFLRTTMQKHDQHRPTAEAAAPEREKAVRLAEKWLRNAGLYAPLEQAVSELFDQSGRLNAWEHDDQLRQRIADLWHTEQPRAQRADREALERAAQFAAHYHAAHPVTHRSSVPVTNTDRLWRARTADQPDVDLDHPPPEVTA